MDIINSFIENAVLYLANQYPLASAGLIIVGTLTTSVSAIVKITPTKKDDAFLADVKSGTLGKVLDFFERFSAIRKKVKK